MITITLYDRALKYVVAASLVIFIVVFAQDGLSLGMFKFVSAPFQLYLMWRMFVAIIKAGRSAEHAKGEVE